MCRWQKNAKFCLDVGHYAQGLGRRAGDLRRRSEHAIECTRDPCKNRIRLFGVAAFGPKALLKRGFWGSVSPSPMESMATLGHNYARHQKRLPGGGVRHLRVAQMRTVFVGVSPRKLAMLSAETEKPLKKAGNRRRLDDYRRAGFVRKGGTYVPGKILVCPYDATRIR
ncbi:MAG: hypothetical protein CM15mP120_13810 [Pseudomonadota bacterium]|nr:MAG: hypothetical protein CM15mP120_13810 [Pseudomonadota bacterium]